MKLVFIFLKVFCFCVYTIEFISDLISSHCASPSELYMKNITSSSYSIWSLSIFKLISDLYSSVGSTTLFIITCINPVLSVLCRCCLDTLEMLSLELFSKSIDWNCLSLSFDLTPDTFSLLLGSATVTSRLLVTPTPSDHFMLVELYLCFLWSRLFLFFELFKLATSCSPFTIFLLLLSTYAWKLPNNDDFIFSIMVFLFFLRLIVFALATLWSGLYSFKISFRRLNSLC